MTRSVIWCCPEDGQRHLALLTGDPVEGYLLRAVCGRTTDTIRLAHMLNEGEVTCLACRTEEALAAMARHLAA